MNILPKLVTIIFLALFSFSPEMVFSKDSRLSESSIKLNPYIDSKWIGLGIAYSPYRDGESPRRQDIPSTEGILEDLEILSKKANPKWHLIRQYSADSVSESVLQVIRDNNLPIKVMQGAWLSGKDPMEDNIKQIEKVIQLANKYPDIVVAVNLGNEIFVDWSAHKFSVDFISEYLKWVDRVQEAVSVPVTLADDYNFWNKPWSKAVAEKLDFIVLHAYAMWNSQTLEHAVSWTDKIYNDIQVRFPNKQIVLGESGWATSSLSTNGDERLIIAEASERAQSVFFDQYRRWLKEHQIVSFYFQAFDENWKGGEDKPKEIAEKNWGIFRSDRKPKSAVELSEPLESK